jgi:hypothetical protein
MPAFKVWDELNSDEESAADVTAYDAEMAAIEYADQDTDGNVDGIYFNRDVALLVRDESGKLQRYLVSAESEPVYYAALSKEQT